MARRWFSVTVELLGGRGEELWPYPGRVFVVGPTHTFADLAEAISTAFARWDFSHLSVFTLADGRLVTEQETGDEFASSPVGPVPAAALDIQTTKVMKTVERGMQFRYVFDLGDDWTHCCTVDSTPVDPEQVLGIVPAVPMPHWGWGRMPDQYGRRFADDDGEGRLPARPRQPHPMLGYRWPEDGEPTKPVDCDELRGATASGDVDGVLLALQGHDVSGALQQAGSAVLQVLPTATDRASSLALSLLQRLQQRGLAGDDALAEDLLAALRSEPVPGQPLPVNLEELSMLLEGDPLSNAGGFVDLRTGEVLPAVLTDAFEVGEDVAVDVEEEPDRWLVVHCAGSREGWEDMAAFAAGVPDSELRERLEWALKGKGAFRRFRHLIDQEGLLESWYAFSNDRQLGRARQFLADEGIRATP